MPRFFETKEPSSSLLMDNCQFKLGEPENKITLPSTYLHITKVSTAILALDNNQTTSSFTTQLSDSTLQTIDKTTYHSKPH